jgi:asparagine synthase (glutamine-hydrolysing)
MPGIVGLITRMPREHAERALFHMLGATCREKSYVTGTWVEESLGIYVGWVARENSFSDRMPIRNERGDVVLVFSGDEYPEPGTMQRLNGIGHNSDESGFSYLAHFYEEDASFPKRLNGRFHGLLIDRNRGTSTLFNDRYGMHRIHYHESKDAFYFASEAKAILAVRPELRKIDPRGLGEFVACGCTLEWRTLFEGVHVLPGGSKWVFRSGALAQKEIYFDPHEWESQESLDRERYVQALEEVFSRNLPRYFEGPERIGMSLTGGLDTRMILAWRKGEPGSLPCYTFGSMYRDNWDVRVARRLAKACNQPYQVITPGQEFLERFAHYAEQAVYITDGCVDVSRAPDLYLNEKARQIAPVRMTGNYGSEILRGVRSFKPALPQPGLFRPEVHTYFREAGETYARQLQGHPVSFAAFKQNPWNHYGILALEESQLSLRSPYLDNDIVRTAFRAPRTAVHSNEASLRLIADGNRDLLRIPTDRGLTGRRGLIGGAASRALREFSFKAEYAYDMGMPQSLARIDHAFRSFHLERLFLGRHKPFHFRIWYRNVLAGFVQEMLLDPRSLSRPYIERKGLEAIVRGHVRGYRNYTTAIHKVLSLELLHRLFLDSPETSGLRARPGALVATSTGH